jgi:hypothetical protein
VTQCRRKRLDCHCQPLFDLALFDLGPNVFDQVKRVALPSGTLIA